MKVCSLCNALILGSNVEEIGIKCIKCDVHYCGKCAFTINHCYKCGERIKDSAYGDDSHHGHARNPVDARRHPRKKYTTTVEYVIAREPMSDGPVKRVKAMTKDISESGICIYTEMMHQQGQKLIFTRCEGSRELPDAEVVWLQKVDDMLYKVGLQFK